MEGETHSPHSGLQTLISIAVINLVSSTQVAGVTNIWGNLIIYVASYLHMYTADANLSNLVMIYPIQTCAWSVGLVVGAVVFAHYGGKVAIAMGLCVLVIGTVASSFATDMYLFLFLYLSSVGFGTCSICINSIWVSWVWYPRKRGLVTGIVMAGYGAGSALIGMLFTFLMNPDNLAPNEEVNAGNQDEYLFRPDIASRLPRTLRICAVLYAAIGIVSLLFMKERQASTTDRTSIIKSVVSAKVRNKPIVLI